jgi:hypothetical protein
MKYVSFGSQVPTHLIDELFSDRAEEEDFAVEFYSFTINKTSYLVTASALKLDSADADQVNQSYASFQYGIVDDPRSNGAESKRRSTLIYDLLIDQQFFLCNVLFEFDATSDFFGFLQSLHDSLPQGSGFRDRFMLNSVGALSTDGSGVECRYHLDVDSGMMTVFLKFFERSLPPRATLGAIQQSALEVLREIDDTLPQREGRSTNE